MSTRSGKRLHNTSDDDIKRIETELVLKSERKTRSKRVLENGDGQGVVLKTKKRQNYVSYPADEEVTDLNSHINEILSVPSRTLRRNTLREQNAASDVDTQIKKQVRQTRRTKKFSETASEEMPEIPQHEVIEVVTITNGKPKGKKNKKKSQKHIEQAELTNKENDVKETSKKKNKKKKKSKSNSLVEQEEIHNKRKSDMSTDSFHSAAGSPLHVETNALISPNITGSPQDTTKASSSLTNVSNSKKKKKASLRNNSLEINFPAEEAMDIDINLGEVDTTFDKDKDEINNKKNRKKSSLKNTTFDRDAKPVTPLKLNTTFEKEPTNDIATIATDKRKQKSNITELDVESVDVPPPIKISNGTLNTTFEKDSKPVTPVKLNTTFEKEPTNATATNRRKRKSDITELAFESVDVYPPIKLSNGTLNTTFEKDDSDKKPRKSNIAQQINEIPLITLQRSNTSVEIKRKSFPRKSLVMSENVASLNGTFDLSPTVDSTKPSLDTTFDKENKLDSTFDKTGTQKPTDSKSSLISSDGTESTINVTLDKSDEISRISITDDDSKTENILNTTPLLVESSMEESKLESSLKENKTPESLPKPPATPLKREGTFTKEEPEVLMSPKTPSKRQTLPAAGCTPYHTNSKGSQKKSILNLTHSVEKRRSSLAEAPRLTRVAFCSPVDNPAVAAQLKGKVIKSNLKGSNKSFVYEESESVVPRAGRKRSFTHTEGEASAAAKRSRLRAPPAPAARARTVSATAKLSATPQKSTPIPKQQSSVKASKLPNFAALHARGFERMESLDECQQRRARRARRLLAPAGGLAVLARASPRVTEAEAPKPRDTPPKPATPIKPAPKLPTLDSLQRGYTRFGFKMHCDVNPFSVPSKTAEKPKEIKLKSISNLKRPTQPSLAGATSLRRAAAKQTVMREKSFTAAGKRDEKREEFRTVIKGVRTNRRFELQMRSRNINA